MHLLLIGLSHSVAGVELREKAALAPDQAAQALRRLGSRAEVAGSLVLSTCGRTEVYASGLHLSALTVAIRETLASVHPAGFAGYQASLYRLADREAAHHLFRVAAGLDSLLVGETEILGQVRRAVALARAEGSLDRLLGGTADRAVAAARRARSRSGLDRRRRTGAAVGAFAAGSARAVLVGSGEVAAEVAPILAGRVAELTVVSRTAARAAALAERVGARHAGLEELPGLLAKADLAVFAAAAQGPILTRLPEREGPLTILDLGVPRNVEPALAAVPGVTLVGLDEVARAAPGGAGDAVRSAEASLDEDLDEWSEWFEAASVAPTLAALAGYADGIRREELAKARRGLELDPLTERRMEQLSRSLVKKLLLHPIGYLRANPADRAAAEVVRRIWSRPPAEPK